MADAADDAAAHTSFDEFFERALMLDVLTEAEVDALTDAVASGTLSEEGAIERHRAALDAALHPRTIGVVLDLHYVQIATRSFGQLTAFSPLAFEAALVDKCGGGVVSARWACDAAPHLSTSAASNASGEKAVSCPKERVAIWT